MMNVAQSDVINQDPKAYQKQANALKKDIQKQASDKLDELKKLNTEESTKFPTKNLGCDCRVFYKFISLVSLFSIKNHTSTSSIVYHSQLIMLTFLFA